MTCRELNGFLEDYLSGTLGAAERAVFEQHLAACDGCSDYLRSYRDTIRLARAAVTDPDAEVGDEVPEELVAAVLAARNRPPGAT